MPFALQGAQIPDKPAATTGEYAVLIRRVFQGPAAVALVGSGFDDVGGLCDDIAAELAASGRHVVVVPVGRLLRLSPRTIPDETALEPGGARNVWHWPAPPGQQIDFFKSRDPERWLDSLRQRFDSVLLSCPPLETTPGSARIAAMSDAAVLIAEAGRTPKQRIRQDQDALRSSGVKLAGCILVRRR